jgi:hypothetical protein
MQQGDGMIQPRSADTHAPNGLFSTRLHTIMADIRH